MSNKRLSTLVYIGEEQTLSNNLLNGTIYMFPYTCSNSPTIGHCYLSNAPFLWHNTFWIEARSHKLTPNMSLGKRHANQDFCKCSNDMVDTRPNIGFCFTYTPPKKNVKEFQVLLNDKTTVTNVWATLKNRLVDKVTVHVWLFWWDYPTLFDPPVSSWPVFKKGECPQNVYCKKLTHGLHLSLKETNICCYLSQVLKM